MEIKCPKCNEVFDLSEDIANRIRDQIRTIEFENEIKEKLAAEKKIHEEQLKNEITQAVNEERKQLNKLLDDERKKAQDIQLELTELKAKTATNEQQMQDKISAAEANTRSAMMKEYEKKLQDAKDNADRFKEEIQTARNELALAAKESEIQIQKAVNDTKAEYEKKLTVLDGEKKTIEAQYNQLKDFKARQSTKMLGESLEQHCEVAFEQVRMMAFPKAEFGKDNQISKSGSKGDYIFREYDENNVEIISIMFEMKNENDTTATKKKNKDFFKELDKDRREKKCEYAILVSQLESDSDIYNGGIVDVSYAYEKMYVIRPQFFISIISLLKNAALRSHSAKQELERMKQQDVDLQNFEEAFNGFKKLFVGHYKDAKNRFDDAIKEITKAIDFLTNVKTNLLKSSEHLRLANNNVEEMSVRTLAENSPSIKAMLNEENKD